jgi:menaquinone-dependent protoporphyrinogen oxidase
MANILVLYHSYDEQTARIAQRMAEVIGKAGNSVTVERFGKGPLGSLARYDGVLIGAAIRYGHHDRGLEKAVKQRAAELSARPNAFFSTCLSAGGPGHKPAEAQRYLDHFSRNTGWKPDAAVSIAGALRYSKYNPFIRLLMKLIVGHAGGETDASRDYEYTDWAAVERFALEFAARSASPPPALSLKRQALPIREPIGIEG